MLVSIRGFIIGAQVTEKGGVKASLVQGSNAYSFYVKPENVSKFQGYLGAAPVEVQLDAVVYAGQDFETRTPNGALSVQATDVRDALPVE